MQSLGEAIHVLRRRKGWSQQKLATAAKTSSEYISQLETGARTNPTLAVTTRIATALGTTPDHILHRAGLLELNSHAPLDPEVQHIADMLAAWPEDESKGNMRAIITSVGETMEHVLGALNGDALKETTNEDNGREVS